MNAFLDAALGYATRGWGVFPLHGIVAGQCTCGRRTCSSPGKHPIVRHGLHDATFEERTINEWWSRWPLANVAIATGTEPGIVVVDIDLPRGASSLQHLIDNRLPITLAGLTGGGGIHLVYATTDAALRNSTGRLPGIDHDVPGIDLRANGGYIVAPPSRHATGGLYEWLDTHRALAPAPSWLRGRERASATRPAPRALCDGDGTPYGLAVLADEVAQVRSASAGTRNHQLNRSAFALAQLAAGGELDENLARTHLVGAALAAGLSDHESLRTIASGFRAGSAIPRSSASRHHRFVPANTPRPSAAGGDDRSERFEGDRYPQ